MLIKSWKRVDSTRFKDDYFSVPECVPLGCQIVLLKQGGSVEWVFYECALIMPMNWTAYQKEEGLERFGLGGWWRTPSLLSPPLHLRTSSSKNKACRLTRSACDCSCLLRWDSENIAARMYLVGLLVYGGNIESPGVYVQDILT